MLLKKCPYRIKSVLLCATLVLLNSSWMSSCAVLTESQIESVNNLAVVSDTIAVSPSILFKELSNIRLERGLYYAASLTSAETRFNEINALAQGNLDDKKLAERTDIYVDVLNSYLRALRSLSNEARWKSIGTEMRGLGNKLDSAILRFNQLEVTEEELPEGVAKLSGKYAGFLSETYMKNRQAKAVRTFVKEGDTLVALCSDALTALLLRGEVNELINNESEGLRNNYYAYLRQLENSGETPQIDLDLHYVELVENLEHSKTIRNKCVSGLRSLKRAHHKLVAELDKRKPAEIWFEELAELNTLSSQLNNLIKELKKDERK